jgi:arsenate reductase
MADKKLRILFLCTGNSARSIMAEYLIRKADPLRWDSFSAGSNPKGVVHPMAIRIIRDMYKLDPTAARSKSWEEFKDASPFDFVITVCDNARESCPIWPGQPIIAHWSSPDPAAFEGSEEETYNVFRKVALQIYRRLELLSCLPIEKLDRLRLQQATKEIGEKEKLTVPSSATAAKV